MHLLLLRWVGLCLLSVAPLGAGQAATPALPDVEQEILRAALGDRDCILRVRPLAVLEVASATNVDFNPSFEQVRKAVHPEVPAPEIALAEALEDLRQKHRTTARIAAITNVSRTIHLISEGTFRAILSDDESSYDTWLKLCAEFPGCDRIVALSHVGMNSEKTLAVVCFVIKQPSLPDSPGFVVLRREGSNWFISEVRDIVIRERPDLVVTCKLRYFVTASWPEERPPEVLQVAENAGTNLVCSVPRPFDLSETDKPGIVGWVLQVTQPKEYAGQVLTAGMSNHFSRDLRFGRLYIFALPKGMIGDLRAFP